MEQKLLRVASFRNWPVESSVSPISLAESGFYHTGLEDSVKCFSCGVIIKDWKIGDSPFQKHRQLSPTCEFLSEITNSGDAGISHLSTTRPQTDRARPVMNRTQLPDLQSDSCDIEEDGSPMSNTPHTISRPQSHSTRPVLFENTPSHISENNVQSHIQNNINQRQILNQTHSNDNSGTNQRQLQQNQSNDPSVMNVRNNRDMLQLMSESTEGSDWFRARALSSYDEVIDYKVKENRLASFRGHWSDANHLSTEELASAGLYYTGPGDRVQCAYCRGGLYNWLPGDTALGEHIRHFPQCTFARQKMDELVCRRQQQSEVSTSTCEEKKETSPTNNWKDLPAVKIVEGMGYREEVIKKAVEKVLSVSCNRLTAGHLMEAIFDIEASLNNLSLSSNPDDSLTIPRDQRIHSLEGAIGGTDEPQPKDCFTNSEAKPTEPQEIATKQQENSEYVPSSNDEVKRLLEENQRLKGNTTCKVCLDSEVNILFLPCRHLVCCEECSNAVKACPLCRTVIVGTVKTFLA